MMACGVSTQPSDLLPLEGAESGVWSYFGFPDGNSLNCMDKNEQASTAIYSHRAHFQAPQQAVKQRRMMLS